MTPLKLKKTKVKAFRSFFEEQETPEYPSSGLYLIDGKNLDTGGSSNSGKSSLLMAIGYSLNFSTPPASQLQNWNTRGKMIVEQTFSTPKGDVIITRGSGGTVLKIGAEEYHTNNLVQEKLRGLIGIDTDILEALTYRKQKVGSYFLGLSDQNKKDFLTKLLGLDAIEAMIEDSDLKLSVLQKQHDDTVIRVQVHRKTWETKILPPKPVPPDYEALLAQRDSLYMQHKVMAKELKRYQTNSKELEKTINQSKKDLKLSFIKAHSLIEEKMDVAINSRSDLALAEVPEKLKEDIKFLESELSSTIKYWNDLFTAKQTELNNYSIARTSAISRINSERARLGEELERLQFALDSNICDSCARPLDSKIDLLSKMNQISSKKICYDMEFDALGDDKAPGLTLELNEIGSRRDAVLLVLRAKLSESKNNYAKFQSNKDQELKILDLQINSIKQELAACDLEESIAINKLEADSGLQALNEKISNFKSNVDLLEVQMTANQQEHENAKKMYQLQLSQYQALADEKEAIKVEMQKETVDMNALAKAARLERDFMQMMGREGFLGNIFDEVLNEISIEVSDMLRNIPNVSRVTFKLKSEKEVKSKGTTKKTITPVVYKSGVEIPLQTGLSGGMLSVVELAVDLAVTNVVARRTGFKPGFMMLDEAMDGLGPVEKDAVLTLLRDNCYDRLVLIVDHDPATKELMNGALLIESKNEESRISDKII